MDLASRLIPNYQQLATTTEQEHSDVLVSDIATRIALLLKEPDGSLSTSPELSLDGSRHFDYVCGFL